MHIDRQAGVFGFYPLSCCLCFLFSLTSIISRTYLYTEAVDFLATLDDFLAGDGRSVLVGLGWFLNLFLDDTLILRLIVFDSIVLFLGSIVFFLGNIVFVLGNIVLVGHFHLGLCLHLVFFRWSHVDRCFTIYKVVDVGTFLDGNGSLTRFLLLDVFQKGLRLSTCQS